MPLDTPSSLDEYYDDYPRIEIAFQSALDVTLNPRGPDMLYDIVASLNLPRGANVVDLGCGEGRHSIKLAELFGFSVHGIDPVPRHIELANEALGATAKGGPAQAGLVRFELGTAEAMPVAADSVDLIWCREVLVHVEALDKAFAECRRVLRDGGHMLIYHMLATDRLEPGERARMLNTAEIVPANFDASHVEAAFANAGFRVDECIELCGEWEEYAQEETGRAGKHLLRASRMLRDPEPYIAQFGQAAYNIMLGDCLWHIYQLIGKLSPRVYLLRLSS